MSDWVKPRPLKSGDTIGVIAPSDAVDKADLLENVEIVKKWGLKVKMGKHVFAKVGDFCAGTAEERQADLQEMVDDPEIKVIWAATGGYAATEVLPWFTREIMGKLRNDPKWFIGYSDVCLILNALTSFKIHSIMGPTLWGLPDWDAESTEWIRKMLFGEAEPGVGSKYAWKSEIPGEARGRLVVSNLETLIFSFGTRFDPVMYGSGPIILGIEELDIEKSTLQRQIDVILSHKRAARIQGVIVGRLTNIRELSYPEWGKDVTASELIIQRIKKWGKGKVPLAFLADFGHAEWDYLDLSEEEKAKANRKFLALPNGLEVKLRADGSNTSLEYLEPICLMEKSLT